MKLSLVWGELGKKYCGNISKIDARADINLLFSSFSLSLYLNPRLEARARVYL